MKRKSMMATLLLTALGAASAPATTLLPASLQQMARAADLVVVGRIVGAEGRLDERRGMVVTHSTLLVEEVIRGDLRGRAVRIVSPGGTDGVSWTRVPGAPDPGPPGSRVLAFLYAERGDKLSNVVFWQGLFHLEEGKVRENGREAAGFLAEVRATVRAVAPPEVAR